MKFLFFLKKLLSGYYFGIAAYKQNLISTLALEVSVFRHIQVFT